MNFKTYREETKRTLPNLSYREVEGNLVQIYNEEAGLKLNLSHMALGLAGEIGEIVSCVGTELKQKIDRTNLGEELGDFNWYLSNYCNFRNIPIPEEVKTELPNDMCLDALITSTSDLVDLVKRFIAYNKEIDRAKELNVVYDIYAALHLFENVYDMEGSIIREKNINKLRVRYPHKFSDNQALNRDTNEEQKVL